MYTAPKAPDWSGRSLRRNERPVNNAPPVRKIEPGTCSIGRRREAATAALKGRP